MQILVIVLLAALSVAAGAWWSSRRALGRALGEQARLSADVEALKRQLSEARAAEQPVAAPDPYRRGGEADAGLTRFREQVAQLTRDNLRLQEELAKEKAERASEVSLLRAQAKADRSIQAAEAERQGADLRAQLAVVQAQGAKDLQVAEMRATVAESRYERMREDYAVLCSLDRGRILEHFEGRMLGFRRVAERAAQDSDRLSEQLKTLRQGEPAADEEARLRREREVLVAEAMVKAVGEQKSEAEELAREYEQIVARARS